MGGEREIGDGGGDPHFAWRERSVGVIGLGLIGGSWGGAARRLVGRVHGCDSDPLARAGARERGLVDEVWEAPGPWLGGCDLVVLAVPPRAMREVARSCLGHMRPGATVTDVCSVKEAVVREVTPLLEHTGVSYVPGHPLAGKERSGVEAACPDLFRGAPYVLCDPYPPREGEAAWQELACLVQALGGRPLRMGVREHDRLVAASSHLPYLAAIALARVAGTVQAGGLPATAVAASGFRDTTRVALSPVDLWADILVRNDALREVGFLLMTELQVLLDALGGDSRLPGLLAEGRAVRERVEPPRVRPAGEEST